MARKIDNGVYRIRMSSGSGWLVDADGWSDFVNYVADLCLEERYYVVRDRQGAEFGMGRDFTVEEWRQQAIEWADMDENDELVEALEKMPADKVLDFIDDWWSLDFAKSEVKAVHGINSEGKSHCIRLLDSREFKTVLFSKKYGNKP